MLRRGFCAFILLFILVSGLMIVANAQGEVIVKIDGVALAFEDQQPVIINDRVLVPMRKIFEDMGAYIVWDEAASRVIAIKESTTIVLTIGDNMAKINDVEIELDVPAQLLNGRTMVPLRFIGEAMGAKVNWEEATSTVSIVTGTDGISDVNAGKDKDDIGYMNEFEEMGTIEDEEPVEEDVIADEEDEEDEDEDEEEDEEENEEQ